MWETHSLTSYTAPLLFVTNEIFKCYRVIVACFGKNHIIFLSWGEIIYSLFSTWYQLRFCIIYNSYRYRLGYIRLQFYHYAHFTVSGEHFTFIASHILNFWPKFSTNISSTQNKKGRVGGDYLHLCSVSLLKMWKYPYHLNYPETDVALKDTSDNTCHQWALIGDLTLFRNKRK